MKVWLDIEAVTRGILLKKGVVRNFTNITGKHLCQSLFFKKVAGFRWRCYRTPPVAVLNVAILFNQMQPR